jgi:hypothetical protein
MVMKGASMESKGVFETNTDRTRYWEGRFEANMRGIPFAVLLQAEDWLRMMLNPYRPLKSTQFEIRSLIEILPQSLKLPLWPDRACSIIANVEEDQGPVGMLMGFWHDHSPPYEKPTQMMLDSGGQHLPE